MNANVYENVTLDSTPHEYKVIDNFTCSDHRPVIATFTIKVIRLSTSFYIFALSHGEG